MAQMYELISAYTMAAKDPHRPFYEMNPHTGFSNTPRPPQVVNRLSPSAPEAKVTAENPSNSLWSRLKSAVSPIIDNNRAYEVPEQIQADTISLERFPYIKVTTDLTASSRDNLASDAPAAVRNREVWVKLDKESYDHLVDMAVHSPILEDNKGEQVTQDARRVAYESSSLANIFNYESIAVIRFPAPYRGMDLSHIADQIQIDVSTTGHIKPVSGDNRFLTDGEYVEGTAEFTGFRQGRLPANDDRPQIMYSRSSGSRHLATPADFGLREEGLSPKTRELATIRNPYYMPQLQFSM